MSYEKEKKLSELLADNETLFGEKVSALIDDSYDTFAVFRRKCINNEKVWRNRHWDEKGYKDQTDEQKARPNTPVLHSTVENCVADIMDQYPDQIIRGVNYDDDIRSLIANEIARFTFERTHYKKLFKRKVRAAYKRGEGTILTFWNPDCANGTGDIDFKYLHINNMFWDKNADDINSGRFFGYFDWVTPEEFYEMYPGVDLTALEYEDETTKDPGTEDSTELREEAKEGLVKIKTFMWKEREPKTLTVQTPDGTDGEETTGGYETWINTVVMIGGNVLERHIKQYKYDRFFVSTNTYIQFEGEAVGLSLIDIFKDDADIVNLIDKEYIANLQASSVDRLLVNRTAGIDTKDLLNYNKKIILGNVIHEGAVRDFRPPQFSNQALNYKQSKKSDIKEMSGQTEANNGMSGGISSAAGLQTMIDYAAKKSRAKLDDFYDGHAETVKDVLKLAQTHYTTERIFRLSRQSQDQMQDLVKQAAQAMQEASQAGADQTPDEAMKTVLPDGVTIKNKTISVDFSAFSLKYLDLDYDIEIIPQRKSPATSQALNSIIQAYANNGSIPPDLALELTEFEGKDQIIKKVRERFNITAQMNQMSDQLKQSQAQLQQYGTALEKMTKQNTDLQSQVWDEKFKELKIELLNRSGGNGGEGQAQQGGQPPPQTAEEAMKRLRDEISAGAKQGA